MSWHDYFLLSVSGNRLSEVWLFTSLQTFASSSASSHTFCMQRWMMTVLCIVFLAQLRHCIHCILNHPSMMPVNILITTSRVPYLVKLRVLSAISFWTWHSWGTFPLRILPVCWERLAEPLVCKIFNSHLWQNLDSILGGGWAHEDLVVDHVLQLLCWGGCKVVDHQGGNQPWTRGQTSSSRISNISLKGAVKLKKESYWPFSACRT